MENGIVMALVLTVLLVFGTFCSAGGCPGTEDVLGIEGGDHE